MFNELDTITRPFFIKINARNYYQTFIFRRYNHPDMLVVMTVTFECKSAVSLCTNTTFSSVDISLFQYFFYFLNGYLPALHSAFYMVGKNKPAGVPEVFRMGIFFFK